MQQHAPDPEPHIPRMDTTRAPVPYRQVDPYTKQYTREDFEQLRLPGLAASWSHAAPYHFRTSTENQRCLQVTDDGKWLYFFGNTVNVYESRPKWATSLDAKDAVIDSAVAAGLSGFKLRGWFNALRRAVQKDESTRRRGDPSEDKALAAIERAPQPLIPYLIQMLRIDRDDNSVSSGHCPTAQGLCNIEHELRDLIEMLSARVSRPKI